ncbi:uncharacterized protein LOC126969771 isoform X2 [Leptidea sinapis]|uniref:uncharacterized protein LOC126969771 isoform X2 n=1 Tax=Leptidea sinapis TaxID=189913 RepID=UPI002143DC6C|nr:uncharacterized protein LOC126969771 isoform X2 [Leptidea sinapis]
MYEGVDDFDFYESLYENGHWEWDMSNEKLMFYCDLPPSEEEEVVKILKKIDFRDDIDVLEQHRFKKFLQRKTEVDDVVTLQDVKDVVIFTAPMSALSPEIIGILHMPPTERFLRALILYTQFFIQVSDEMNHRTLELERKIRTENGVQVELKYREDLEDLRLLVAKEYCIIILGGEGLDRFHHMGPRKKLSLSKRDIIFFKNFTRIAIQIVWIALGRKCFKQVENEINRILKSDIYNSTVQNGKMNSRLSSVLRGQCLNRSTKLNVVSPLINEVFCDRHIDHPQLGLGVLKYSGLSQRLLVLETLLCGSETKLRQIGLSLGIVGLRRAQFDIMLHDISVVGGTSNTSISTGGRKKSASRQSNRMSNRQKSSTSDVPQQTYLDIHLPEKSITTSIEPTDCFPTESRHEAYQDQSVKMQKCKWLRYIAKRKKNKARLH